MFETLMQVHSLNTENFIVGKTDSKNDNI